MENLLKSDQEKAFEPERDRQIADSQKNIPGWGVDADPENDPTYPMKHWNGADHERLNYQRPTQQPETVEVLHSIERPSVSSVFGTVTPPTGLSGALRRYAFQFSESTYMHWVPLVVADRIGVVEGIVDDLKHGHVPNIFAEKGWGAEWKYNRQRFIQRLVIQGVVVCAVAAWLTRKRKK